MAQKQYTTYQADILSFELRDALLGVINPGRYIGFNDMSEYQAQSGSSIFCRFSHTTYAKKYDQTNPTPVLEANRGIAISTQGTIIAEDSNVDVTVTIVTHGSGAYHVLYMEHAYLSGTPGANPATFGVKHGTGGGNAPALDYPTRQVVLGIIRELPNAADFDDLEWHPAYPQVGDINLYLKLFLTSLNGTYDLGDSIPAAGGIIGNRNFSTNNYVTDFDSITKALGDIDAAVKVRADAITALAATKLDDWATPDDNTDLNATITHHGLLPILPDDVAKFLNGIGGWTIPEAGVLFVGSTAVYHYNSTAQGGSITMGTTQQLALTAQVPAGYDQVMLSVVLEHLWGAGNPNGRYGLIVFSKGGGFEDRQTIEGLSPFASAALLGSPPYVYNSHQLIVPLNGSRQIQLSYGNHSGATTDWLRDIQIKVVGYR